MKLERSTALAALVGVLLAVAIGPGLSIFRCLMTGEIYFSCCCEVPTGEMAGRMAPENCCATQRLEPPWKTAQTRPFVSLPEPVLAAEALVARADPEPAVVPSRTRVPPSTAPPRWLLGGALLL